MSTAWDYRFELDGKYYNQYINEKEKDTLFEEIDNQPVIDTFSFEFNRKTKSKEDKLPKKLRKGW